MYNKNTYCHYFIVLNLVLMIMKNAEVALVRDAVSILQKNIKYSITVPQIADQLAVSEKTLQRAFQQVYQVSVYAWFKKLKIEHAQIMLHTGYSVKQASMACGYKTESAFVQAFKDVTRVTPGEWSRREAC